MTASLKLKHHVNPGYELFFLFPSNLDLMNSCLNFHNIIYLFKLHLMQILHKFTRLAISIQNL